MTTQLIVPIVDAGSVLPLVDSGSTKLLWRRYIEYLSVSNLKVLRSRFERDFGFALNVVEAWLQDTSVLVPLSKVSFWRDASACWLTLL